MATLDLQEQEQVEALKAWWQENGRMVMLSIAVVLVGFAGIQLWRSHQAKQAGEASALFAEVGKQVASKDPKRVNDAAQAVIDRFGSSAYASRAELLAVEANIQAKDIAKAKTQLQWVLDHSKEDALKDLARLKLASLLLDEKNYAEALNLLEAKHPESFDALYSDLKGDVLVAQGKTEEAHAAYQVAYDKMDDKSTYRNLIQMKLDSVGGAKK
ncbi:MAG: tetratricopeptide repeat protein [Gallionellaceae bacterium]